MKNLLLAVFIGLLCVVPNVAGAQGLKAGDQTVSVFLGGAAPLQESGIYSEEILGDSVANEELDWGDVAGVYGAQYLYSVSDHFAFGLEYMGYSFDEAEYERSAYFDRYTWDKSEVDSKMQVNNFMFAGRYTVNPQNNVRFYIPFGLGLARAKATISLEEERMSVGNRYEKDEYSESASSNSFAYYLGVGIEGNINQNWLWGAEARYSAFTFDYSKFGGYEVDKKDYSYLSILLKLSYRF